jgi:hypothetical protein
MTFSKPALCLIVDWRLGWRIMKHETILLLPNPVSSRYRLWHVFIASDEVGSKLRYSKVRTEFTVTHGSDWTTDMVPILYSMFARPRSIRTRSKQM